MIDEGIRKLTQQQWNGKSLLRLVCHGKVKKIQYISWYYKNGSKYKVLGAKWNCDRRRKKKPNPRTVEGNEFVQVVSQGSVKRKEKHHVIDIKKNTVDIRS